MPPNTSDICSRHINLNSGHSLKGRQTESTPWKPERNGVVSRNPHVKRLDILHRPAQDEDGSAVGQAIIPAGLRLCEPRRPYRVGLGLKTPDTFQGDRRRRVSGHPGWSGQLCGSEVHQLVELNASLRLGWGLGSEARTPSRFAPKQHTPPRPPTPLVMPLSWRKDRDTEDLQVQTEPTDPHSTA